MDYTQISIIKRDGKTEPFSLEKIVRAITKAFRAGGITDEEQAVAQIASDVAAAITKAEISVEEIQDMVEERLMKRNPSIAKRYIIYREWRKVFNEYNPPAFAVAEAWVNPDRQHLYASTEELGQVFNFEFAKKDWIRDDMHLAIEEGLESAERSGSSATWVMSNHDVPRHASRYGLPQVPASSHHQLAKDWLLRDGTTYEENRELGAKRARAAILMELALPGSTYIYQGEELGLPEVADIPWDELEDPTAFNSVREQIEKGRDGCRVPLPWVAADAPKLDDPDDEFGHDGSFGFSPAGAEHDPHLPQPKWYKDFAVDVEDADPNSMLNLYRKALSLRHNLMPQDTELQWLDEDRPSDVRDGADGQRGGVIAYSRSNGWASVTNFGERPAELPQGDVILASGELTEDGRLPQDTTVWLQL